MAGLQAQTYWASVLQTTRDENAGRSGAPLLGFTPSRRRKSTCPRMSLKAESGDWFSCRFIQEKAYIGVFQQQWLAWLLKERASGRQATRGNCFASDYPEASH
ncbi:hypothetical protein N7508_007788 [Penicillium antarcticum]|uniref:uncharacterized protein n=1 Tax=Penicillium antarcticum TaxID=416450 RepID=UPI002396F24C|nr:uncharacterized protein N7508_007788 [Penicillium antarcticum]KAJ5297539.1 hypothetical protein N7508_007788 [Penicillium antarcticum]